MKAFLFKEDGSHENVQPENQEEGFTLQRLQKFVKGPIEVIPVDPCGVCGNDSTMIMIVNEEGRLHGLRPNYMASGVAKMSIVGSALYCPSGWVK
tara:strand:- start:1349 stop:1633 length:285 start_codon:yes stop_codon:yes gene_type:complete